MPSKSRASGGRWAMRFGVAIVLGSLLGAGGAVLAVNRLDPARPTRTAKTPVKRARPVMPPTDASWPEPVGAPVGVATADRAPTEAPLTTVEVPGVVGLEEGEARAAMIDMGLQVGAVQFRSSSRPAGIVLATIPSGGTLVAVQASITLVLSDGRGASSDSALADSRPSDPLRNP